MNNVPAINLRALAAVLVCMLAVITLRLSLDQWQGYNSGMRSLKDGDRKDAVMYFDRVLDAHIPFSPFEKKAKAQLLALAAEYEKEGEPALELLCYETIRTSRYLTRHFFVPDSRDIPFLNERIASVKAQLLVKDGMVKDFDEGYGQQMGIMNKDHSPSVFWSFIAVVSFWMYLGFIVLWIFKRKQLYVRVSCLAFVVWLAGLYFA